MTQNDNLCITEVELQFLGVFKNCIGPFSGIEKNLFAVSFYKGRKTPLPEARIRQHGGENGNLQSVHLGRGGRGRGRKLTFRLKLSLRSRLSMGAETTREKKRPHMP